MALTDKLTAIGSAIRNKTGSTDLLTLDAMPTAIGNIQTSNGLELPETALTLSGNCDYKFYYGQWDWFIEKYGDKIKTENVESGKSMFGFSQITSIPFDIVNDGLMGYEYTSMFANSKIETVPYIKGSVGDIQSLFSRCYYLQSIPNDWSDFIDWSMLQTSLSNRLDSIFYSCYSLKNIPNNLISNIFSKSTSARYASRFSYCYSLDEIKNIAFQDVTFTNNAMLSTFTFCSRAKGITFVTQSDGTPYTAQWKTQTIDLSQYVGYVDDVNKITDYNSGITLDKQVTDDTTYQALKDDPDWFTADVAYSRYNHDSAVETINSLPDTSAYLASAGGTNIIKFTGASGSATDGGAINTLTDEEIAVATAKGWTVTLA